MAKLMIEYPDSLPALSNLTDEEFAEEARLALAAKLYEMGRLTSGQAASLAGCSRVRFLLSCERFGTPSVAWDKEEIDREKQSVSEVNA